MNVFRTIAVLMVLAAGAVAQSASTATARPQPSATQLPKNATANPDGTWSATDDQGRQWVYRKTDLGYSRAPLASSAKAGLPAGIPPDAVPAGHGDYTWTDKTGKKWTYRTTMFGVSRVPYADPSSVAALAPQPGTAVKVTDKGNTVRFEKAGPLGPEVWEKKKSELTPEEQKIYSAQQKTPGSAKAQ